MLEEGRGSDPGAGGGPRTPWGHMGLCWAHRAGTSLGVDGSRVGAGRGCWVQLSRRLTPHVGRGQPSPRMDAPGRAQASCREPAPVPAHREPQLLQKAEGRKFKQGSAACTRSCRGHPSGCTCHGWVGCPGLASPPTALQTLRAGKSLLLPWKCVCSYSQKKRIVNEKTRWKRGSKLNATAVMLHLSCKEKIKFCLPLEVSSGKNISSLSKWHHIVSSFQPAASLVPRSIFFQENTRVT